MRNSIQQIIIVCNISCLSLVIYSKSSFNVWVTLLRIATHSGTVHNVTFIVVAINEITKGSGH